MALLRVRSRRCSCGRRHREHTSLAGKVFVISTTCRIFTAMSRDQNKADSLCKELEGLNPGSKAIFLQKDISSLKNVDDVCLELQRREKKINILFLSAGYMSLSGRKGESLSSRSIMILTVVIQRHQKGWITKWPLTITPGCALYRISCPNLQQLAKSTSYHAS